MKKVLFVLTLILPMLISCSSEDDHGKVLIIGNWECIRVDPTYEGIDLDTYSLCITKNTISFATDEVLEYIVSDDNIILAEDYELECPDFTINLSKGFVLYKIIKVSLTEMILSQGQDSTDDSSAHENFYYFVRR